MPTELTEKERDDLAEKWIEAWQDDSLSFDALLVKLNGLKEASIVKTPKDEEEDAI